MPKYILPGNFKSSLTRNLSNSTAVDGSFSRDKLDIIKLGLLAGINRIIKIECDLGFSSLV